MIGAEDERYFERLEEVGVKLTIPQKRWWVKKAETLGGDMRREYPVQHNAQPSQLGLPPGPFPRNRAVDCHCARRCKSRDAKARTCIKGDSIWKADRLFRRQHDILSCR